MPPGHMPEAPKGPVEPCAAERRGRVLAPAEGATPRIASHDLFGGGRRLIIEHGGREYALLITRQGKLVLNRC